MANRSPKSAGLLHQLSNHNSPAKLGLARRYMVEEIIPPDSSNPTNVTAGWKDVIAQCVVQVDPPSVLVKPIVKFANAAPYNMYIPSSRLAFPRNYSWRLMILDFPLG